MKTSPSFTGLLSAAYPDDNLPEGATLEVIEGRVRVEERLNNVDDGAELVIVKFTQDVLKRAQVQKRYCGRPFSPSYTN